MADEVLSYKGFDIAIDYKDADNADLKIGGRTFAMSRHEGPLSAWMCDEAYFAHPELEEVARHLVDYWYIVDDDERKAPSVPHDHAAEPAKPKKRGGGGGGGRRRSGGHSGHGG